MADSTDFLLTAILAPIVSGLVLFFVGLFVGRELERKDRSRQDDQARIYEPLYAQVVKLLSSEEGAKQGFSLNTPEVDVIDAIVSHGLLVQPRHRTLKKDVETLSTRRAAYHQASWDYNIAANKSFDAAAEVAGIDDLKSDSALFNAVLTSDNNAGIKRIKEIIRSKHGGTIPMGSAVVAKIFDSVMSAVVEPRATRRSAEEALLRHARSMKIGLESALKRGKYRPPPSAP